MNIKNYIGRYFAGATEIQNPELSTWLKWYKGFDKTFHEYSVYNGTKKVKLKKKSLNMAKKSCEDWANLLLNEKCEITIKDQDKLNDILEYNSFKVEANNLVEQSFALSMGAIVESLENVTYNEETGEIVKTSDSRVKIDYVDATKIYPITFKNKKLIECAFVSENTNEVAISIHKLNENKEYDIINLFIETDAKGGATGNEREFIFHSESKTPLFQIIKPNICNNRDIGSPLGISVYANSIDTLKAIDNAYDSFDNEIQSGRMRIMVDDRYAAFNKDGEMIDAFDPNDALFYRLPAREGDETKPFVEDVSGSLRTNEIGTALQEQLNTYAASVGFGKNYYTFGGGGGRPIQTATGIIAQNSDLFRNLRKHELLLEKVIKDMVEAIAYLSNTFTINKIDASDVKVMFDDSIIEDTESKKNSDRTDVTNGIMSKQEYRAKWFAETEDIAKEKLDSFGLNDLDTRINALLPALQSGAITPTLFVEAVYKDKDNKGEIAQYIEEQLTKTNEPINFNEIA
jgi:A118 family predicted phage portal protein